MDMELIENPANTIDRCRYLLGFLQETMCCGSLDKSSDLSGRALDGLGFLYEMLEEKLQEASDGSKFLYMLYKEKTEQDIQTTIKSKAAA